jgi:hypothetical protein
MTKAQRIYLVVIAFVAGCGGSQVARWVVPVARANTPVQRWEYDCRDARQDITAMSNEMGKQGWELAAAAQVPHPFSSVWTVWCYKRPLP